MKDRSKWFNQLSGSDGSVSRRLEAWVKRKRKTAVQDADRGKALKLVSVAPRCYLCRRSQFLDDRQGNDLGTDTKYGVQ